MSLPYWIYADGPRVRVRPINVSPEDVWEVASQWADADVLMAETRGVEHEEAIKLRDSLAEDLDHLLIETGTPIEARHTARLLEQAATAAEMAERES